ncbi:hypothetical protein ACFQZ8_20460, partial [Micromonospora azadirachtae]
MSAIDDRASTPGAEGRPEVPVQSAVGGRSVPQPRTRIVLADVSGRENRGDRTRAELAQQT